MLYPEVLLPHLGFRIIESNLPNHHICRTTPTKNFRNSVGLIKDEELFREEKDFFDYSTNHLGQFKLEDNYLSICGENKKYFREYWNIDAEVTVPIIEQDFKIDDTKGIFFFKIDEIHLRLKFPLEKNSKGMPDNFTAVVKHTPTNSNFWHFSIRWIDQNENEVKANKSAWKNALLATIRAKIQNYYIIDEPSPNLIDEALYK